MPGEPVMTKSDGVEVSTTAAVTTPIIPRMFFELIP
jgi:hypothetical protein